MEAIIPAVPREKLIEELTNDKFIRRTNYGNNEVFIFTNHDSPNLMKEVARLREIAFRIAGGGTGKKIDIDEMDTRDDPYHQLIVWDPEDQEILGGYRFYNCMDIKSKDFHSEKLSTSHYFNFSEEFINNYLPHMVELGRSFVHPIPPSGKRRKSLFALDNLWDGLGTIVIDNPGIRYFFGKVTMYPRFDRFARDMILHFLYKHYGDPDNLITPVNPLQLDLNRKEITSLLNGKDYKEDYKILSQEVRKLGENIPPLINAYMNLTPTMKTFGTIINKDFGNVEETGIMVTLKDLYISKVNRHLASYREDYQLPSHN